MPTEQDFLTALSIAQDEYKKMEPNSQLERSGSIRIPGQDDSDHVELPFLGTHYVIRAPNGEVRYRDPGEKEPALWERIIVLHYFTTADGSPLSQKWITVKEIPDSRLYLPNFEKRAVVPLLGRFGKQPEEIREPARKLGGRTADIGDISVTIPVFPRVPITLVIWKGDEEFPPRVNILFDEAIVNYLPTEDIILASQMLAFRLIGLAGKR